MGVKTDVHEVMTKGNISLEKADELVTEDKAMEENKDERGAKDNEVEEDAEQERALNEDMIEDTNGEEKFDEPEEEKSEMREGKVGLGMCERGKRGEGEKEPEPRSPTTGTRPVRVIKSIPRLIESIERDAVRKFYVEEGYGTPLKDIPNVAYKLSKRENDDTLKLLHTILFSRRGKGAEIQNNISQFSGFVWQGNEEKQRIKLKEKLEKCVKEKLLQICDVLDIPITKATTKKVDIIAKLMDFLEVPHPTTDELLAEKEQGKKRKKGSESGQTTSNRSAKSRRTAGPSKVEAKKGDPAIDDSEEKEEKGEVQKDNVAEGCEEKNSDNSDSEENFDEWKDESGKDAGKPGQGSNKVSGKKIFARKAKTKSIGGSSKMTNSLPKTQKKQSSKPSKAGDSNDASRKAENEDSTNGMASNSSATKEKSEKNVAKWKAKSKETKPSDDGPGETEPSDDKLKKAIYDLMKVVDFNTTTFIDMTNQLGKQFNTNLRPKIYFIKDVIAEELERLSEDADAKAAADADEADANAADEGGAKADDKADDDVMKEAYNSKEVEV